MPYQALEVALKRFGLSDSEAVVYVSLLGLGPSSVLRISRKAGVARATTYLVLSRLAEMGLVSTYERSGSLHYVAEEPDNLRDIVQRRKEEIFREEKTLEDIIPKLKAFVWSEDSRPMVRYYHGREGLQVLRSEMLRVSAPGETWYNFTPMDHLYRVFGKQDFLYDRQRLARRVKSKTLFTTNSDEIKKKVMQVSDSRRIQRRFIKPEVYSSGTGVSIFGNRVAVGTMEDQLGGFIVESASVATMMRELFNLAWESAGKN